MRTSLRLAQTIALFGCTQAVWAQLTAADIASLQQRGVKEGWTFTVGENGATQYPLQMLCGGRPIPGFRERTQEPTPSTEPTESPSSLLSLPASFDWRTWNCVTPIKDQMQCGSCWAHAAIGAMESAIYINDRSVQDLSEQWLVSCTSGGTCLGGWHDQALDFLRCGGPLDPCGDSGAVLEIDFPYVAFDVPCGCPYNHPYCLSGWGYVSWPFQPTDQQLKQAIFNHGPIAVAVYADAAFQAYTGGIFNACTNNVATNHVVVLVGWDDNQGVWFLRNSWGTTMWGENGYMRIQYGCSRIGYDACFANYADSNWAVWLDFATSGTPDGSFWAPYATLDEAVQYVDGGGVIAITAGSSATSITITKPVTLEAVGGTVTIGQ